MVKKRNASSLISELKRKLLTKKLLSLMYNNEGAV